MRGAVRVVVGMPLSLAITIALLLALAIRLVWGVLFAMSSSFGADASGSAVVGSPKSVTSYPQFGSVSPRVDEHRQRRRGGDGYLEKKLRHGGHPVLTMCATNADHRRLTDAATATHPAIRCPPQPR